MTWRHRLAPALLLLTACPGPGFFDDDFCCGDTFFRRDTFGEIVDGGGGTSGTCIAPVLDFMPADAAVETGTRPWVLFALGVTPTFTLRDAAGTVIPRQLLVRDSAIGTLYQVLFTTPLTASEIELVATWPQTVDLRDPADPSRILERRTFCSAEVRLQWSSGAAPSTVSPADAAPTWLRSGGEDPDGQLLTRLLDKAYPSGRALRLSPGASSVAFDTLRRTPGLPSDQCDAADTVALSSDGDAWSGALATWILDASTAPLVLHDVDLSTSFRADGSTILSLSATADLTAWPEVNRAAVCDGVVAYAGRRCEPCGASGPDACVPLSMQHVRTEPLPTSFSGDIAICED